MITDETSQHEPKNTDEHGYPELAIVIPTFNEAQNIRPLVVKLKKVLKSIHWEIIFVDDNSPDNTAEQIKTLSKNDYRIRCIERLDRRGLSSACIEGFLATQAPYVCVMDADLQHDERLIPNMFKSTKSSQCELALASRYIDGGNNNGLSAHRALASKTATLLSRILKINTLSDPMSGFFLFKMSRFKPFFSKLYGEGFKILLDLISAVDGPITTQEFAYEMRTRVAGNSKMDALVIGEYLMMLIVKLTMGKITVKFILFMFVGLTGVGVHLSTLAFIEYHLNLTEFLVAQSIATFVAMTSNFFINNLVTYRDRRLKKWQLLRGLLSFYLVCSIGALLNISFATLIEQQQVSWMLSGAAGAAVGAVWNYTMSSIFTWKNTSRL